MLDDQTERASSAGIDHRFRSAVMACPPALVVDLVLNLEEVPSVDLAINTHEDVASSRPAPRSLRPVTDRAHTERVEHPRILACRHRFAPHPWGP
jgi:hypothetical protein